MAEQLASGPAVVFAYRDDSYPVEHSIQRRVSGAATKDLGKRRGRRQLPVNSD
jgi:hypothetical protein